jgi:Na+/proline symporter
MSIIDWLILSAFILFVVIYGSWKTRNTKNIDAYIRAGKSAPWFIVTLSIMATQASAITFLSTPGQAYVDGMRFLQFYLGLPIAMIILSIAAVPVYHKLNIYTAYEFLEKRFDLKNRLLGSILFLLQRGLAAGFTIFAPALILSVILKWNINYTILITGGLVIIYTTIGGTRAVNQTHLYQMIIITLGMFTAFFLIFHLLPKDISPLDALQVAGKMGKLNTIDFSFNLNDRYTFWSGLIGGTFLMLSYFGTDQSQVQRYLGGSSITQSRVGLLMNGIIKIPMQFFILLTGALVFVFYQFITPPLYFNPVEMKTMSKGIYASEFKELEKEHADIFEIKKDKIRKMLSEINSGNNSLIENTKSEISALNKQSEEIKNEAKKIIKKSVPASDGNDTNYIFISFVIGFLPIGVIGLVIAAILSASMSSTSAELNALASTTVVDIYKRLFHDEASDKHYLAVSKLATVFWGVYAIIFALFANKLGTLIEAVNILGSLVYGTILGIFMVAFFFKRISGTPTFIAALVAELTILYCYFFTEIPFLWFNVISCAIVVITSMLIQFLLKPAT